MKRHFVIFIALGLVACQAGHKKANETVAETSPVVNNEVVMEEEGPLKARSIYHATETVYTDLIHTKLEVSFNWAASTMNGQATITAKPHFYATDSLILDAKGMDIYSVQMGQKALNYTYDSSYLRIQLDKKYTRTENYTVSIKYLAKPEQRKVGGSAAITSDKGLYFINPKGEDSNQMPQIWTQGETEASSVWFPTIDAPNVKTTQEIFITVDAKYNTLSNGKFIASKKNADGTKTDHWKQDLPHAPYLFMMGVGEFKIVKDSYTRPDGSKMEVNYYVEPEWEPYARDIFGETPAMIGYFSKLLGVDYAWDKYNQIVVRDYVSGAMENTGAVIFGDYAYKNKRELLDGNDQSTIAHELFHHWFGDLVTCESWSNLPLNESFANYSQYLWDEFKFGIDEADYQAEGETDGYYQSAESQGYHDLIWFDYEAREQMFDGHSYNKGGRILHMLRNHLGDEAFFKGIQLYLTTNKFKAAEFHQLRLAFEEVSGQDLNWFFNQWFLGSGHPQLEVNQQLSADGKQVSLSLKQVQNLDVAPIYKLPIQIALYDDAGMHLHTIVFDQLQQEFTFPVTGKLNNLLFDYSQSLLGKVKEAKPEQQYVHQYYNGKRYRARRDALLYGTKISTPESEKMILDGLNDPFWHIRMLAIDKSMRLSAENKKVAFEKINALMTNDPISQVRNHAVNFMNGKNDNATSINLYKERILKDSSYMVVSSALKQLAKMDATEAMKMAQTLENEKSSKMALGIAQLYGNFGKKEQFQYFDKIMMSPVLQGFDQLTVLSSFTYYMSKQDPETLQKGIKIYSHLNEKGNNYTKMFLGQSINYLLQGFDAKIATEEGELVKNEKDNPQYAAENRKNIKALQDLKNQYQKLIP